MPATFTIAPSGARLPLSPTTPPVGDQRLIGRIDDVLVRIPFHVFQIFGDGTSRYRQAIAVQVAVVQQRFHQERHATSFEHILGDITASPVSNLRHTESF